MTTLAIMATYEKKRLKCYGTVAAGEHVAVTITDGAQWIGEGTALRLRVLFGPDTVAVFPFAEGDTWTAAGTQDADAACELNLNTVQAEKYLKRGGTCLWILDDVENHTLYATGEFDVLPWPKRRGIDEPIDLDGYPLLLDEINGLREDFEAYQQTVSQMLAAKQDTIFDLAAIRSGAAAGATAVQPPQIARFVDGAEYRQSYGKQNNPAILFMHGADVIVALDATPFVKDGMVSDARVVNGNLVITFNTDSGKQPIELPLTDIFDPSNYYTKTDVDGLMDGKQDALTFDNAPTYNSQNSVKSGGIWSAIWGALSALPTGFSSLYDWCLWQLGGKASKPELTSLYDWCVSQLAGKASKSDVDPFLFVQYYPEGNVKSAAEFTVGIKYDDPDTANRTITVKPFCNTGTAANDNSSLVGRVVIPPFVDAQGNGYISDGETRFRVVGVSGFSDEVFGNTNLTAIVAPNTVTTIGDYAFCDCTSLTAVSFSAAQTIESDAFYNCAELTSVSLPAAMTIGDEAFCLCTSLASVDFGDTPRPSVPSLGSNAFDGVPTACKIIVPYAQYDEWKAASGWSALPQEFVRHSEKADKPATFTAGNFAKFDSHGNPADSGKKPSDFQEALLSPQLANIAAVSSGLAFDATHSYAVGDPVVYNGVLYVFTAAHTAGDPWDDNEVSAVNVLTLIQALQSGKANNNAVVHLTGNETVGGIKTFSDEGLEVSNPEAEMSMRLVAGGVVVTVSGQSAYFYIPSVEIGGGTFALLSDLTGKANKDEGATSGNLAKFNSVGDPVDSEIPAANVALKSDIPYALGVPIVIDTASSETVEGETVNYGEATLANRTANIVQVTAATALDELRITFPAATSGKVRDFGLRVEIGTGSAALTAPALVPIAPTGETIKIENADGTIPALADGTATAKGVTLLYFSENAQGVFVVKGEQVEEVV